MSAMTVWWFDKPSETVCVWMLLHIERVIARSKQWPRMCVEKVTCCFKSNEVRVSPKVVVAVVGVSN